MSSIFRRPIVLLAVTGLICGMLCGQPGAQSGHVEAVGSGDQLTLRKTAESTAGTQEVNSQMPSSDLAVHRTDSGSRGADLAVPKLPDDAAPSNAVAAGHLRGVRSAGIASQPSAQVVWYSHRVTDGDSLTSLAARYLGDESRSRELFEANRDVLKYPDVLPLGTMLRIPSGK